jgi:antitoxin component YwqK of YwqJK toxin-antitoxin module
MTLILMEVVIMERPVLSLSKLILLALVTCLHYSCEYGNGKVDFSMLPQYNLNKIRLRTNRGITYVEDKVFSGTIYTLYPNTSDTAILQTYYEGKENGEWKMFYPNKQLKEIRYFEKGKKIGKYTAWWENGKTKSSIHFNNDEYEGLFREWNLQGQLIKEMNYMNGHEVGNQKVWYDNGKIKTNYTIINGRRYGLLGTKNCINITDSIFAK